jgi:hypothetical protein
MIICSFNNDKLQVSATLDIGTVYTPTFKVVTTYKDEKGETVVEKDYPATYNQTIALCSHMEQLHA